MRTRSGNAPTTRSAATPPLLAVAVVLIAIAVLGLIRPGTGGGAGPTVSQSPTPTSIPSPSPTPSPRPTPSPSPSPTPSSTPTPSPSPSPTPSQTPTPSLGPPPCEYLDELTPRPGYPDWPITLLDTIYRIPAEYTPGDLVDSGSAGVNGGYPIRALIANDLRAMAADARSAGVPIMLVSGFRSHAQQEKTFAYWVAIGGYEQALRTSARPGHSEHQLGTAIDVTTEGGAPPWEYADWGSTPAGAWMASNAWRYGFVMSYPAGVADRTCYDYEPWHYRYVGRDLAALVVGSERPPREVLWELQ